MQGPADEINPEMIMRLFAEILECCENDLGEAPKITMDDRGKSLQVDFEDQSFKVYVQDLRSFQ